MKKSTLIIGLWLCAVGTGAKTSWFPFASFGADEEVFVDMMTLEINGKRVGRKPLVGVPPHD